MDIHCAPLLLIIRIAGERRGDSSKWIRISENPDRHLQELVVELIIRGLNFGVTMLHYLFGQIQSHGQSAKEIIIIGEPDGTEGEVQRQEEKYGNYKRICKWVRGTDYTCKLQCDLVANLQHYLQLILNFMANSNPCTVHPSSQLN